MAYLSYALAAFSLVSMCIGLFFAMRLLRLVAECNKDVVKAQAETIRFQAGELTRANDRILAAADNVAYQQVKAMEKNDGKPRQHVPVKRIEV